jgi:2-oxoglutarate dehydrogenase E2 component (dihydrolipoamide succinyltransferase)
MALAIKIPTVGESITEVVIASWRKKEGDTVKMNDVLCELESDKASFELQAEADGVLHITAKEGETISIGAVIGAIETNGAPTPQKPVQEPKAEPKSEPKAESPQPAKALEVKVPTVGESISEVTNANWLKNEVDTVALNDILCEIESDKATFELAAEASGLLHIVAKAGTTLPIGGLVCTIEVTAGQPLSTPPVKTEETVSQPQKSGETTYATGTPSPAAQKILSEKGIEPKEVNGSGVDGRITKEDALKAEKTTPQEIKSEPKTDKPAVKPPEAPVQKPQVVGERGERRERMTQLRKTVARRLVAVKNETAMLTTFNEVDMKPIMDMRNRFKDKFKEKYNIGLGFMSFFTKACCVALQEWPAVNAMIDGDEIVYHNYCDISVAVSSPRGLVVPIVRNAEKMSFSQIEGAIAALAVKARDNKLTIDEMTGGTFTITNGGVFGSMLSTPIINAPQTAILGMHNIVERPVVVDGQIVIRPIMYVALSYDHRIIDGKEAVSFLVRVKQILEDPARMLFDI